MVTSQISTLFQLDSVAHNMGVDCWQNHPTRSEAIDPFVHSVVPVWILRERREEQAIADRRNMSDISFYVKSRQSTSNNAEKRGKGGEPGRFKAQPIGEW
jgi:hypothetical protein